MSDSTSTPSLTSEFPSDSDDLTTDLDLGFDGAEDILRAWRNGMRPDPDLTVSEWADQHRKLSSRASAEPGQYRTARTPYLMAEFGQLARPVTRVRAGLHPDQAGPIRQGGRQWKNFSIWLRRS